VSRFANTYCSQCGEDLGPGDSGVSHCSDHRAGHTRGPWILADSNSWRRIVAQHNTREVCVPIKQRDGHPDLHFPNPADAPLMLAAPELLEACETVLACLERGIPVDADALNGLADARIRAAIAKATGGAA